MADQESNPILADAMRYASERATMANPKGWEHVQRKVSQGIAAGIYPTSTPEHIGEAQFHLSELVAFEKEQLERS